MVTISIYHNGGVSAFSSASFRSQPNNQDSKFYTYSDGGVNFDPSYVHVSIQRMGNDRYDRKSIKDIIVESFPSYFD